MTHQICDSCETVAHCRRFGCVPIQSTPVQDTEAHYKGVVEDVQKLFENKRAQPAKQWVGLTDEEIIKALPGGIYDCLNDPWDCGVGDGDMLRSIKKDVLRIARAIEAKLKEKNT